jgi:hypothetical protein
VSSTPPAARRRRGPRALPTCRELVCAPELAILAAVENATDLAIVALVAAQPDLQPSANGRDVVSTAAGRAADTVIEKAQALLLAIAAYRTCLQTEPADLPF